MLVDLSIPGTQAELAAIVGVTQPNISVLISEGKLPPGGTLGEMVQAYCHRLRGQAAGRMGAEVGGFDLVQERAALAREMRIGHAMKNAISRGDYAPIGLLAEVLAMASQSVVERFEQLPSVLKKVCPDLPDAAREQVLVMLAGARNEWVRATCELVAKRFDEEIMDSGNDELELDL